MESTPPSSGARKSRSADEARRRQIERELAMTPLERALLALRLGRSSRYYAELARKPR
jgi:hypothetical protein